ncbi:hypothetical protein [Sphingomonas crocodyli]|uniref:Uncharacterized protein n=1 Tax=Sphingomonas crocodyli TaxID=1979270 RepID=A0A437M4M1_9SPHN|nr:hypothetical protein [Sphingomonas crocodyli]RVT92513.1 hypothetical protein EOD43_00860 [Sphingomonas crocodyli]
MAREMKEHELASPVDLPAEPIEGGHPLAYASVAIIVATLVLFFANAGTLSAWVDEKPPSDVQLRASEAASGWAATMDAIGIGKPRTALHDGWKKLQAARFGDEAAGGMQ